jgi:NADP-dependent 3-hydroxy acid dehydrogenase YdfG
MVELERTFKTDRSTYLTFDVRDIKKPFQKIASLPEAFSTIDILINNAGNAHGLDPIQNGDLDDWDAMIDINVKACMSKAIIPQMIENQVILSTSVPLLQRSLSNGNVYCATKHAVDALKGMRMDLNPFGIRVGAIHPEWCRLNLVKCALKEIRIEPKKSISSRVHALTKISPTSFTLWYRDRIISTLPI